MDIIVGRKIKKYRQLSELTQEKLAEKTELSLRYIQKIETEGYLPSILTLARIATILKKNLKDFF